MKCFVMTRAYWKTATEEDNVQPWSGYSKTLVPDHNALMILKV
jgi:hypothetical protein